MKGLYVKLGHQGCKQVIKEKHLCEATSLFCRLKSLSSFYSKSCFVLLKWHKHTLILIQIYNHVFLELSFSAGMDTT